RQSALEWLPLRNIKELGPALFIDMAQFARERLLIGPIGVRELSYQLFYSYLLPQFEGISDEEARRLWKHTRPVVGAELEKTLLTTLRTVLGVTIANRAIPADDFDDADEEPTTA